MLKNSLKLNNSIAFRTIGNTCIVTLTNEEKMFFLNKTADSILKMIDQEFDDSCIINRLMESYEIKKTEAERDYKQIVNQFISLGIVRPSLESSNVSRTGIVIDVPNNDGLRGELKAYCQKEFIPLQCLIELTSQCNLVCRHCYVPPATESNNLDINIYKKILQNLSEMGCLEIIFTGGEVFLNKDCFELFSYARKLRFSVLIKSNATLLSEEIISNLLALCITEIQVSLYSMNAEIHDKFVGCPGSHSKTLNALRYMHKVGQRCRISCVVTMSNYQHLAGLKDFAVSINASIGFDLTVTSRLDDNTDPLSERLTPQALEWLDSNGIMSSIISEDLLPIKEPEGLEKFSSYQNEDNSTPICGAANTTMAISPSGDVRPCIPFPISLGNVREMSLQDIWWKSNKVADKIRRLRNHNFTECNGCKFVSKCPRCIATIYQETGNPVGKAEFVCRTALYHNKYGG